MNRSLAAITSLALAMPASALAKEPVAVKVCGKKQCHESRDKRAIAPLAEGGPPTDPPSRGSDWYSSTLTIAGEGGHARFTVAVVPAQGLIRGEGGEGGAPTWMPMTPEAARVYRKLTAGLEPRPASKLTGLAESPPPAPAPASSAAAASHEAGTDAPAWPWLVAAGLVLSLAAVAVGRWKTA